MAPSVQTRTPSKLESVKKNVIRDTKKHYYIHSLFTHKNVLLVCCLMSSKQYMYLSYIHDEKKFTKNI